MNLQRILVAALAALALAIAVDEGRDAIAAVKAAAAEGAVAWARSQDGYRN
jgi:hypothetical protein